MKPDFAEQNSVPFASTQGLAVGAGRHVLRAGPPAASKVAHRDAGEHHGGIARKARDLDRRARRCVPELEALRVIPIHHVRRHLVRQIRIHENHVPEIHTGGFQYLGHRVERLLRLRRGEAQTYKRSPVKTPGDAAAFAGKPAG